MQEEEDPNFPYVLRHLGIKAVFVVFTLIKPLYTIGLHLKTRT